MDEIPVTIKFNLCHLQNIHASIYACRHIWKFKYSLNYPKEILTVSALFGCDDFSCVAKSVNAINCSVEKDVPHIHGVKYL